MKRDILVIEDDEPLCWLLERILKADFNVTITNDGLAAMAWLLKGNLPSLILCDYDVPRINGLEFLRNLRLSGAYKDICVIMVSGMIDPTVQKKCIAAGANGFIEKPFDPSLLIDSINDVLKQKATLLQL
jgi:two-component system, chemotaxis family, chemotaxis protein CheY